MLIRFLCARQRVPVSCFSRLSLLRWYSEAKPTDTQPIWTERQKRELYDRINRQKEVGLLSWDTLSDIYKTSADSLRDMYDQAAAKVKHDAQLRSKISSIAQQNYDKTTGRLDWEKIAREVGLPVFESLQWFSYVQTSIKPRELPEKSAWPKEDIDNMNQFINHYFPKESPIVWDYVAKYTNVSIDGCMNVYGGIQRHEWTEEEIQQIGRYRKAGLSWHEIKDKMGVPSSSSSYKIVYNNYIKKQNGEPKTHTSSTEGLEQVRAICKKNPTYKRDDPRLIDLVASELPDRSHESIKRMLHKIYSVYSNTNLGYRSLSKLFDLVEIHGQDWIKISKILDRHPVIVEKNWIRNKDKFRNVTEKWTEDEISTLKKCIDNGMTPREISRIISTKAYSQCVSYIRNIKIAAEMLNKPKRKSLYWTLDMDERLVDLVKLRRSKGQNMNWRQIGEEFGCSNYSAKTRYRLLTISKPNVQPDVAQAITNAVKKQFEANKSVDWTKISKQTGHDIKTCLESSQYDEGKRSWSYDPNTYSEELEKQVREFVQAHYILRRHVDYRALSNHLWITISDTAKLYCMVFNRKIKTAENIAKVRELRAQGLTFPKICLCIGPHVSATTVSKWLNEEHDSRYQWTRKESNRFKEIVRDAIDNDKTRLQTLPIVKREFAHANEREVRRKLYSIYQFIKNEPSPALLKDKELIYKQIYSSKIPISVLAEKYKTSSAAIELCVERYIGEQRSKQNTRVVHR